ncbi:MAG: hypothetical protein QOF15_1680 [Mycobacterium sp.]|jgi:hypothetical protein|nr:hypothetical protein [Mycobacterium sp.]
MALAFMGDFRSFLILLVGAIARKMVFDVQKCCW